MVAPQVKMYVELFKLPIYNSLARTVTNIFREYLPVALATFAVLQTSGHSGAWKVRSVQAPRTSNPLLS
jgi:hypothetical protein